MAVLPLDSLPLGYRFRPTDPELIDHYLRLKINGSDQEVRVIREIDVCTKEPWELPGLSAMETRDPEWFFFCPVNRRYPNGHRLHRATCRGYWKATGKDRKIKLGANLIGMKKTLVFYTGRAPRGKRTFWVMHEYRTTLDELDGTHPGQAPFVLCRLFKKQDETLEGSTCDAENSVVASPTAKSSPDDAVLGLAIPQDGPSSATQDKPPEEDHDFEHDPCIHLKNNDVKIPQDIVWSLPKDPMKEPSFFPVPFLKEELGTSFEYEIINDISSNETGVMLQNNNEEDDISEFLNSVFDDNYNGYCALDLDSEITNNGPVGKDNLSCEELLKKVSEREIGCQLEWDERDALQVGLAPGNFHMGIPQSNVDQDYTAEASMSGISYGKKLLFQSDEPNSIHVQGVDTSTTAPQSGDTFGTGIRIRPRSSQILQSQIDHGAQGSAPRRLRFQCKLQIGPLSCSRKSSDFISGDEIKISKSINLEEEKVFNKLIGDGEDSIGDESVSSSSSEPRKLTISDINEESEVSREMVCRMTRDARMIKQHSRSRLRVSSLFTEGPAILSVWPRNIFFRLFVFVVFSLGAINAWRYIRS